MLSPLRAAIVIIAPPMIRGKPRSYGFKEPSDLDTRQCKQLRDAAGRRLGWLRRLE